MIQNKRRITEKMKKIENDFCDNYWLTEQGIVYDQIKDIFKNPYSDNCYKLKRKDGSYKTISQKSLYYLVYGKVFCIDQQQDLQGQLWKPIYDTKDYFVSNYGRIKSYKNYKSIIIKPFLNRDKKGYYRVKLSIDGKERNYFVHRLVIQHFGNKPDDYEQNKDNYQIHHINGKSNINQKNNLMWILKDKHKQLHKKQKEQNNIIS